MDEARVALVPTYPAVWAKRGHRPKASSRRRYKWRYDYAFVHGEGVRRLDDGLGAITAALAQVDERGGAAVQWLSHAVSGDLKAHQILRFEGLAPERSATDKSGHGHTTLDPSLRTLGLR